MKELLIPMLLLLSAGRGVKAAQVVIRGTARIAAVTPWAADAIPSRGF